MVEYWKSLKKHYCIYCKTYLVDNPANRRHHEMGEKHKLRMQSTIDKAKMSVAESKQSANSYYDEMQNRSTQERIFPVTRHEHKTCIDDKFLTSSFISSYSTNRPALKTVPTKKANKQISFSFGSRKLIGEEQANIVIKNASTENSDSDKTLPLTSSCESVSHISFAPETKKTSEFNLERG